MDRTCSTLMFSGGSIVNKSQHNWNALMSVLKLLSERMGREMLKNGWNHAYTFLMLIDVSPNTHDYHFSFKFQRLLQSFSLYHYFHEFLSVKIYYFTICQISLFSYRILAIPHFRSPMWILRTIRVDAISNFYEQNWRDVALLNSLNFPQTR